MTPEQTPGVHYADPSLFIAICWIVSALLLGALVLHALLEARGQK